MDQNTYLLGLLLGSAVITFAITSLPMVLPSSHLVSGAHTPSTVQTAK